VTGVLAPAAEIASLSRLVEERLGVKTGEEDLEKLRTHLRNAYGGESPEALERALDSGDAAAFLTVNETYFFREPVHFHFLRKLLPSFGKSRGGGPRICSAATSTGCEAYSAAMLIEDYNRAARAGLVPGGPLCYHIDAFDINPRVIETAERGVYGGHSVRDDGSCFHYLAGPYLEKTGDGYRVDPALKANIRFFVHNLMDELFPLSYDLIFFRNAFIYFSARGRIRVLSNLAAALAGGGTLITGVSETAGVNHPALVEKNEENLFYFQKAPTPESAFSLRGEAAAPAVKTGAGTGDPPARLPGRSRGRGLDIDPPGLGLLMDREEEAAALTERVRRTVRTGAAGNAAPGGASRGGSLKAFPAGAPPGVSGNELAAAALCLLNRGDFRGAGEVLNFLEDQDDSSFTAFLRGEYFFLQDMFTEAEFHYKISRSKNNAFWPAFYRLSSLASAGALRKHRAGQALESLGRAGDLRYEVFIGGFSPDYYQGALLRQREDVCSFPD
jgi:chemotaxis protein methyltransferase CheR